MIRLTVSMANLGLSDSDEKYIQITEQPIYVRIEGGSRRLLQWEKEIILNGSSSYDPNVINGSLSNLQFKWYCKVNPGSLPFKIGSGGCFGYGENLIEHSTPVWKVAPNAFIQNAVYIITLTVQSRIIKRRSSSLQQYIEVKSGTVLKTPIRYVKYQSKLEMDASIRFLILS